MEIIEESLNIKKVTGIGVVLIYLENLNQVINVILLQNDGAIYTVHSVRTFDTEFQCFSFISATNMQHSYYIGTYNDIVEQFLSEGNYAFCTDDNTFYVMRNDNLVPINGN